LVEPGAARQHGRAAVRSQLPAHAARRHPSRGHARRGGVPARAGAGRRGAARAAGGGALPAARRGGPARRRVGGGGAGAAQPPQLLRGQGGRRARALHPDRDRALPAGQGAAEDGPARRGDRGGAARGARLVSTEHTPDVVTFKVELSPTREGARNRIVVYDWFTRGKDRAPPRGDNLVDVLVDGEAGWG